MKQVAPRLIWYGKVQGMHESLHSWYKTIVLAEVLQSAVGTGLGSVLVLNTILLNSVSIVDSFSSF